MDYFGQNDQTGKNIAEDLSEGKSTLPLIHSYIHSDKRDKSLIRDIFNNKMVSDVDKLKNIFDRNLSGDYTLREIEKYTKNAIDALNDIESDKRQSLIDLTNFCCTRAR